MKRHLEDRELRVLLGGVLVVSGIVGLGHGVPAGLQWADSAIRSAQELNAEVERATAAIAALPGTRDRFGARRADFVGMAPRILGTAGPADAERTLSALVSGAAARTGVSIGAIETSTDSDGAGFFLVVSARVEAEADQQGLIRMLGILESGRELLVFRRLVVERLDPGSGAGTSRLRVTFLVQGLGAGSWNHAEEEP